MTYKVADPKAENLIVEIKTSEEIVPPQAGSNHRFVRLIINMTFTENGEIVASQTIDNKGGGLDINQARYEASKSIKSSMREQFLEAAGGTNAWAH